MRWRAVFAAARPTKPGSHCKSRDCRRSRSARIPRTSRIGSPNARRRAHIDDRAPGRVTIGLRRPRVESHDGNAKAAIASIMRIIFDLAMFPRDTNTATAELLPDADNPRPAFRRARSLGIAHATVKHPPLFTVEQARACAARSPAATPRTCSCATRKTRSTWWWREEDAEIELKGLHRLLGASGRFSFGSADLLREVLGVEPGAVTPFGAINDTRRPRHRGARRRHDGARRRSTIIRWSTP